MQLAQKEPRQIAKSAEYSWHHIYSNQWRLHLDSPQSVSVVQLICNWKKNQELPSGKKMIAEFIFPFFVSKQILLAPGKWWRSIKQCEANPWWSLALGARNACHESQFNTSFRGCLYVWRCRLLRAVENKMPPRVYSTVCGDFGTA